MVVVVVIQPSAAKLTRSFCPSGLMIFMCWVEVGPQPRYGLTLTLVELTYSLSPISYTSPSSFMICALKLLWNPVPLKVKVIVVPFWAVLGLLGFLLLYYLGR